MEYLQFIHHQRLIRKSHFSIVDREQDEATSE